MMFNAKRFYIFVFALCPMSYALCLAYAQNQAAPESDQQINDFSLAGYGEKGKKSWDLSGKNADIFDEVVKLKDVVGNLYGKEEDVKLCADRGDFNKVDGKVHLEEDVVITTSTGTKLTTNSLDWDRKQQLVTTKDAVNIKKDNLVLDAIGAKGEPNLKKVALEKDVKLDINQVAEDGSAGLGAKEKIIITCDGPLEIDYAKNVATFLNNVKVDRDDATIYSDRMDIFFISGAKESGGLEKKGGDKEPSLLGSKIDKIVAKGNVKIVRGENTSYSDEAVYSGLDRRIILSGRPKLILYSMEELKDASSGN